MPTASRRSRCATCWRRGAWPTPQALKGPGGQITFVWQTPLAVSATQIRALLGAGRSVRFLVPDAVLNYIEAHHLYRAPH
ncbi:nicotinic acid mononucleotide adenylyltransferase [Pseudomonas aeruginosa]|nr:nicotinic acid mononucleotide adenylyltransferase [Pseudomonas aeruginosa]